MCKGSIILGQFKKCYIVNIVKNAIKYLFRYLPAGWVVKLMKIK